MRRLAQAGERLAQAQQDVLAGKPRAEFERATSEQRALVGTLGELAGGLLAEAGRAATDTTLERVAATLHAASLAPEARTALVEGSLQDEVAPGGFGQLAGAAPAARRAATRRDDGRAARRDQLSEARRALKEARAAERELLAAARAAEGTVSRLRAALADAEDEATAARDRAEEASEAVAQAAARVEELSRPRR
jgi:hypothetical protein